MKWLKVNKEGAVVGAIAGAIAAFYGGTLKPDSLLTPVFSMLIKPLSWIVGLFNSTDSGLLVGGYSIIYFIILGALVGALIDSMYKTGK